MPRVPRALIALTVVAAALRLPTLGSQSLWLDEVLTGRLARGSLGDLLHRVATEEANPPLFYLLEWAWTRVAGTSEVALRLPSALFGIALVPVAFAIGRRLLGGAARGGGAGRARRRAPAARGRLAGGARLRGGRARGRGRVRPVPRCARGEPGAVVGARLGRRTRLPLLRDLPGRDRGGDPARAPRPRRAARARRRRAGRGGAAAAAGRAGRRRPHRQRDGRHGPGRAREGRRDELARRRARGAVQQPRVAGGRAAARGRGRSWWQSASGRRSSPRRSAGAGRR